MPDTDRLEALLSMATTRAIQKNFPKIPRAEVVDELYDSAVLGLRHCIPANGGSPRSRFVLRF
jgi:hypothetical protein